MDTVSKRNLSFIGILIGMTSSVLMQTIILAVFGLLIGFRFKENNL